MAALTAVRRTDLVAVEATVSLQCVTAGSTGSLLWMATDVTNRTSRRRTTSSALDRIQDRVQARGKGKGLINRIRARTILRGPSSSPTRTDQTK